MLKLLLCIVFFIFFSAINGKPVFEGLNSRNLLNNNYSDGELQELIDKLTMVTAFCQAYGQANGYDATQMAQINDFQQAFTTSIQDHEHTKDEFDQTIQMFKEQCTTWNN